MNHVDIFAPPGPPHLWTNLQNKAYAGIHGHLANRPPSHFHVHMVYGWPQNGPKAMNFKKIHIDTWNCAFYDL